ANAEFDKEICGRGHVAHQQSDMTNGNSWTRIVHHGSPDEGKNLGAEHRHAGSDSDRLITMLHHSTERVARFVNASNFLRDTEKSHACATRAPLERTGHTCCNAAPSRPTSPLSYVPVGFPSGLRGRLLRCGKLAISSLDQVTLQCCFSM